MDITLNVEPDVLIAKAGELSTEKTAIAGLMDQAKTSITSLTGVWKGAASDEYQGRFRQIYDDIDNMLAIISEHSANLIEAANLYKRAEVAATNATSGLQTDGVLKV